MSFKHLLLVLRCASDSGWTLLQEDDLSALPASIVYTANQSCIVVYKYCCFYASVLGCVGSVMLLCT